MKAVWIRILAAAAAAATLAVCLAASLARPAAGPGASLGEVWLGGFFALELLAVVASYPE